MSNKPQRTTIWQSPALIASRTPFHTGSGHLTADAYEPGMAESSTGHLHGHAARVYAVDRPMIDFIVWSYWTPIAWHTPSGWKIVEDSFSISTTKHQSAVRRAVDGESVGWNPAYLSKAQRALIVTMATRFPLGFTARGGAKRTLAVLAAAGLVTQDAEDLTWTLAGTLADRVA